MNDPVMQNSSSPEKNSSSFFASLHADRSLVVYTIVAIGLAVFVRYFIAAPYIVQGASMEPTFYDYHYLITDKVSYRFDDPQRGDVIVLDLPQDTSRALIKRVIGLPGERITVGDNTVTIVNTEHPEGFVLDEPYVDPDAFGGPTNIAISLGADQYFVLGDNRKASSDSRSWGPLPREDIVGRVIVRLFPFMHIGVLPGSTRYQE